MPQKHEKVLYSTTSCSEADLTAESEGARSLSIFYNHLVFYNHFEKLKTVLFEVELIINNAPLTYVYPNTTKTCLTLNHLLLGRQLLYSSNTTSADKTNRISNHFWDKWRHE